MKYKLINRTTNEQHLCDKVIIDGWDYYVSDGEPKDFCIRYIDGNPLLMIYDKGIVHKQFKVIATNNYIPDIPKVVDEVEELASKEYPIPIPYVMGIDIGNSMKRESFIKGYNKSQETHPNSDEDMIEFAIWLNNTDKIVEQTKHIDFSKSDKEVAKELLQLWKEQQPKTEWEVEIVDGKLKLV